MSGEDVYEIFALKYGSRSMRTRNDTFIFADDHNSPHPIDYFVWVIRNRNHTILVDTGYDTAEGEKRGRLVDAPPREILKTIDVDAEKIEEVIVTHLHYDHAGTLNHFPSAKFYLQEAEMAYATGPCMCHDELRDPFTADHICDMVRHVYSGRVVFVDGDAQIAPNITVHQIGGHSKGLQCVRVLTKRGWVVLASDASHFYENFQRRKMFPIVLDAKAMLDGFETLYRLADSPDHIIPGHDPLVLVNYPPVNDALQGIAHRLDAAPRA